MGGFDKTPEVMATVRRRESGSYFARWYSASGHRHEEATGEYQFERALRKANRLEAEARFWEDHAGGLWTAYAAMNYSPRFLWQSFTHAKHLRFDRFRELLSEAGIKFAPRAKWRDKPLSGSSKGKRYAYRGKRMTVSELIDASASPVANCTVAYRLKKGWDVEDALRTPPMSNAESGRLGADKVNGRGRAKR